MSSFFWHPVAGYAMLSWGWEGRGGGGREAGADGGGRRFFRKSGRRSGVRWAAPLPRIGGGAQRGAGMTQHTHLHGGRGHEREAGGALAGKGKKRRV